MRQSFQTYPTDFLPLSGPVNAVLMGIGRLDCWLVSRLRIRLPLGLSVVAVGVRE